MWDSDNKIGYEIEIADTGANSATNNITINRAGSDTIIDDSTGLTSVTIAANGDVIKLKAINSTTYMVG
jgi:hypothetical protein